MGPTDEPADPSQIANPPPKEAAEIDRLRWRLGVIEPRYQATRARETTNAERLANCRDQLPPAPVG